MRKHFAVGAAVLLLVGALWPGAAGAAPTPKYTVSCSVGGNTTAKWQRVTLSQITFSWLAPADSTATFPDAVGPVPTSLKHGLALLDTPAASAGVAPATVTVTFRHADGSAADQVTAACT